MGFLDRFFGGKKKAGPPTKPLAPDLSNVPPAPTSDADWEDLLGLDEENVPHDVACEEVQELIERGEAPALLDVREQFEREADGYIAGSVHIPMGELQARIGELNPAQPVVVYCASGMRSLDAGAFLLEQGFGSVANLAGGMASWHGPREHPGTPPRSQE